MINAGSQVEPHFLSQRLAEGQTEISNRKPNYSLIYERSEYLGYDQVKFSNRDPA